MHSLKQHNAPQRPEYNKAFEALEPVLYNLPPKIIAIDGRPGVGKTTLGRFLAWMFNVSLLETDLFLLRGQEIYVYRKDEINNVIETRIKGNRPMIVEGVIVLQILEELKRKVDYHIHVVCADAPDDNSSAENQLEEYERNFSSKSKADLVLDLPVREGFIDKI